MVSLAFFIAFAAAAALRRFFCAAALACAVQASGNQSLQTRQGLSWVQSGWPSFNSTVDSGDGYHSCAGNGNTPETLAAIRLTTTCHVIFPPFSLAGTAWQRRKHGFSHVTYLTKISLRPTGESSNSHTTILLSSSSITPGKATGSVSDWTRVRSLARRKSKWTMGGCGALRRCGCAWTYEGTQFLCVKFRLGSAGEPTICSHCYDVLNEDIILSRWLWII